MLSLSKHGAGFFHGLLGRAAYDLPQPGMAAACFTHVAI
jgi:hypothetical protein